MGKSKTYHWIAPELHPIDLTPIYKEMAKELNVDWRVVEYVVRNNFRMVRKFINTASTKDESIHLKGLGSFICYKNEPTPEQKEEKHILDSIMSRFYESHLTEEDVESLKKYKEMGYRIPIWKDVMKGRRRAKKQLIKPEVRRLLPENYFEEHGAVWTKEPEQPKPIVKPMNPEDSVMEKFKDEEYNDGLDLF